MKNLILSILSVILLSCHPVTASFASVIKNETVTFPTTTNKDLSLCKDISAFAYVAMQARQNGISKEVQLSLAPVPTTQAEKDIKLILDEITYAAYQLNIVESKYGKAYLSNEFGKQVYMICVGDSK